VLLLPQILEQYRKSYPEIEIFVEEGTNDAVTQWIAERRVDVGFVTLPDERFDTQFLVEDRWVAIVPANHKLAARKSVTLSDLCDSPFIMTTAGSTVQIEALFDTAGLRPQVKYRCSQNLTIIKMVEAGAGVSIISDLVASEQVMAMGPGVAKKPLSPPAKRSIGLAVPNLEQASPAVHAFLKTSRFVTARLRRN
jgi:DNA-binding transcriptional LysR family regulator